KREKKRLLLFVRMAKGEIICPDYVPTPELGELGCGSNSLDSCAVCEHIALGQEQQPFQPIRTRLQHLLSPQSEPGTPAHRGRGGSDVHSAKGFRDRHLWRREQPIGSENRRPPTTPTVHSDPLP
ncbi:unnamed protein product, partial [Sphacelaria rigidula]